MIKKETSFLIDSMTKVVANEEYVVIGRMGIEERQIFFQNMWRPPIYAQFKIFLEKYHTMKSYKSFLVRLHEKAVLSLILCKR